MDEIRQEQLRNIQLKERRPQRLAPLHQRGEANSGNDTVGEENIGEGLREIDRAEYAENQIQDVLDDMEPSRVAEMPIDDAPREPSQMQPEAQDEAQPSASALEQAEWNFYYSH